MIQKNYIAPDVPTGIELAGVRCYNFSDRKIYEQIQKPQGNKWEAVGSNIDLSGQQIADFLFSNDQGVDFSNTGFTALGVTEKKILAISNMI